MLRPFAALVLFVSSLAAVSGGTMAVAARDAATPAARAAADLRGQTPLPLAGERLTAFKTFVAGALAKCETPGAAVAVVQDGNVVWSEGFGVRQHGRPEPVTADTLFAVGSVTKPVTATMAATLVDAGLVDWTTRVRDLLPDFALSDPRVTAQVTLADLFSAASGLPRRDAELSFEADPYSPEGLLAATSALPLASPLGERYHYSNQAFAIGGYAAAAADGASPRDLRNGYFIAVQDRLLNPLGMSRSTFRLEDVVASGDYAVPHAPGLSPAPQPIPLLQDNRFLTSVAPAGALWASANDLAKFVQMELQGGIASNGTHVVSRDNLQRTWQPGVGVPPDPALPAEVRAGLAHYGLGWFVGDYGGLTLISHSGGTYGFSSEMAFLPQTRLGIVVLTNDAGCGALVAFAAQYRLFELLFDLEPEVQEAFDAYLASVDAQRVAAAVALGDVNPDTVRQLAGTFTHPALGTIELRLDHGALLFDAGEVRSQLRPLRFGNGQGSRYVMVDPPLAGVPAIFSFTPGPNGRLRPVLTVEGEPGEAPIVYPFVPIAPAKSLATPVE